MKKGIYFVTGIDTNVGKTYATGILARQLAKRGISVTTQKMIQTGCVDFSEDIDMHRQIQGIARTTEDHQGLSCPYIFTYPCSPHLAVQLDNATIDTDKIRSATQQIAERYDVILLEGAGGLLVPITNTLLTADYIQQCDYPVIIVTSGKLGSINHTLLTLEVCKTRNINVHTLLYNSYPKIDSTIESETISYLKKYIQKEFPSTHFSVIEEL